MGAQIEFTPPAGPSFLIVRNGAMCAPWLVQRECIIRQIGREAARKIYQTAYAPNEFPTAKRVVSSDDPLEQG
jgi:hypothetical protein